MYFCCRSASGVQCEFSSWRGTTSARAAHAAWGPGAPQGPGRAAAPSPQPAARAPSQTPCPAVPFPKLRVKPARYCQFEQPLRCVLHGGPSRHFHHLRGRGPAALNWLWRRGCGPGFAAASRPARTHPATCSLHGTR